MVRTKSRQSIIRELRKSDYTRHIENKTQYSKSVLRFIIIFIEM